MSQGVTHATNTIDATATPATEVLRAFDRRYQAHNPAAGRNERREVLFSAAAAHSVPNSSHGRNPIRSSNVSAIQKMAANSNAERLVSQIQRVHQKITLGRRAHAHEDQMATFSEKILRAIRKIGTHVNAEQILLNDSSTIADDLL